MFGGSGWFDLNMCMDGEWNDVKLRSNAQGQEVTSGGMIPRDIRLLLGVLPKTRKHSLLKCKEPKREGKAGRA